MWTIDVRLQGDLGWQPIWSGDGGEAERDARRRYEQVRERINGHRSDPENIHAELWVAVRLLRDGVAQESPQARVDVTQPFRAAGPADGD